MNPLRFGLIGYGAWGRCHASAIAQTPGCDLRAVCAQSEQSRNAAASETGAALTGSIEELVSRPDLDVIDIVAPNHLHESAALAAFAHGKHVLLEKPLSTTIASCDRIIAAANESGRLLLVGHEMRFSPMYGSIR